MNEYVKSYGEPGEPKIQIHILSPGMDMTICGLDLVHDKPPKILPKGKRHVVTCVYCLNVIEAVEDHLGK